MNKSVIPENMILGFSYVPIQCFDNLYSIEEALNNGTIFKDLNIPFKEYKNNPIMNPFK